MKTLFKRILKLTTAFVVVMPAALIIPGSASAACAANSAPYGQATGTFTVTTAGTYRVWSRILPDPNNAANNSYTLEIDDTLCGVNVGDATISATTPTWVDYQNGNPTDKINYTFLTAGTHSYKLYGRESGVKLYRIVFAADTTCVPAASGNGDDCANPTTPPPVVEVPNLSAGTHDDLELQYDGSWLTADSTTQYGGFYGRGNTYTDVAGNTATFKFTGTGFKLYGAKDSAHGIMTVSIDGGAAVDVDEYATPRQNAPVVYERLDLSDATHTVVITTTNRKNALSSGTYISIDRVDTIGATTPPNTDVTPPLITFVYPNITTPIPESRVVTTVGSVIFKPTVTDASGIKFQSFALIVNSAVNSQPITLTGGQYETPQKNADYTFAGTAIDNADLTSTYPAETIKLRNPDVDRNGKIITVDILTALRKFNTADIEYDFNADGSVAIYDLLFMLRSWKP